MYESYQKIMMPDTHDEILEKVICIFIEKLKCLREVET